MSPSPAAAALVEHTLDLIVFLDQDGRIVLANRASERILGLPPDSCRGQWFAGYFHPDDLDLFTDALAESLGRPDEPCEAVARVLREDGSVRQVELVFANRLATPQLGVIVCSACDRTAERQMQAQLMVSDRLVSIGSLAGGLAHEINNPLSAVLANLELAGRSAAHALARYPDLTELAETTEIVADARSGAERIRSIVRDLRLFARGDEDHQELVDVRRVLDSAVRLGASQIRRKAEVVKRYGPVPLVEASLARLGQVFLNLLLNAVQAIPAHTEKQAIFVSTSTDERGSAVVSIRDTGAGIAPDVMKRLFEPFFTTKPLGVGTGLGLSISHGIVTSLGGTIAVESEPGRGAEFRVVLPAADELVDTPAEPVAAESSPAPARRGRVLLIDDEVSLLAILRRALARHHDVVTASSAAEALAHMRTGPAFDVIFCDLMMPVMSGMQLHAQVTREMPGVAATMVFLTGGAFTADAAAFLESNPNHRVEKPFDPLQLRSIVASRLRDPQ